MTERAHAMRAVAFSAGLLALSACRGGPSGASASAVSAAAADPNGAASKASMAAASPNLPALSVVMNEPKLAGARELERNRDYAGAARAVREARPLALSVQAACAWDFLEGRLWASAGASADALVALTRAESVECPLAGHATLRASQVLLRSGRAEEALERARHVPSDHAAIADDVKLLIAEVLAVKGERAQALGLWRTWLSANPYGSRWVDTSIRLATALLDGVDGPPESRAREAYDAATRVIVEAPRLAESSGALSVRSRASRMLSAKDPTATDALHDAERARQAQAWLDAGDAGRAFEVASSVIRGKHGQGVCKAAITRAQAAAKKTPKGDAWDDAVTACEHDPELVTALYSGAKARASKDPKIAIAWFQKLEARFPAHRLADDARFRGALLVAQGTDEGHAERSTEMLRTLPDLYPAGDMGTEALFRLVLNYARTGRVDGWAAAKPVLDRMLAMAPDDRHWATAGRAEYFRARADAMTGDMDAAITRWARVIERHPLAYYMLLSYGQLAARDRDRAKRVLEDSVARDRGGIFPSKPLPILETPAFVRALRLLEVGEADVAKREWLASGALADGADPEVVWTVGALYNRAGLFDLGHAVSRGRVSDHLAHYPEGSWRVRWETAYPRAFEGLVRGASEKYGLPTAIAWGIMREESSFVADVKSHANAYGLMQLIVPTAKGVATGTGFGFDEASLKRPEVSIELGTKLLASLRTKHGHDALAIGAYNGGSGAIGRWVSQRTSEDLDIFVESITWEETRNYIKRVLSSVAAYGYLYDARAFEAALALPLSLPR
jgi:soluble lytic murein transglycosylase